MAQVPLGALELPRKVTVYLAPPPSDYLDITLTHFRQYIKPVLVAAAVDYEVKTESRQGEIRNLVAEEIRNKRRKSLGLPTSEADPETRKDALDRQIEQNLNRDKTGGIIIIGRGAYKEYLNGVQEGWLGPLEDPNPATVVENAQKEILAPTDKTVESLDDITGSSAETTIADPNATPAESDASVSTIAAEPTTAEPPTPASSNDDPAAFPDRKEDEAEVLGYEPDRTPQEEEEAKKKAEKPPVPKPYINGLDKGVSAWTNETATPNEFALASEDEVSQPIGVMTHRHILGFLNMPIRVYRFFTRRHLADELGRSTAAVIFAATRPFDKAADPSLLIEEEHEDWPSKWKQKCVDKNSEWMWEFGVDERVAEKLRVYALDEANLKLDVNVEKKEE
jgi:import inner membrane translocase subunit TIM54